MTLDADQIIALLDLKPHPEGGFFRESFRDQAGHGGRAASTAIYFLLKAGQASHWHRVDAAEVWHFYAGAPLDLSIAENSVVQKLVLGANLEAGERPQAIVPAGAWQSAGTRGAYTLVGCTVAPAFTFDGFDMAPPDFDPFRA